MADIVLVNPKFEPSFSGMRPSHAAFGKRANSRSFDPDASGSNEHISAPRRCVRPKTITVSRNWLFSKTY